MPPLVSNLGGSVTGALGLVLAIWGYKAVKNHIHNRPRFHDKRRLGRFFTELTPTAILDLVERDPFPHLLIDVRTDEEALTAPLPLPPRSWIRAPVNSLSTALALSPDTWAVKYRGVPYPRYDAMIVCVGSDDAQMTMGASIAKNANFERIAVVHGGVAGLIEVQSSQQQQGASDALDIEYLSRDGVAALLRLRTKGLVSAERNVLIDVRRNDERALYGSIRGSLHIPCDIFAAALNLDSEAFERQFHFAQPRKEDVLIIHSRTKRRAQWAAQLAREAGYKRVLVYKEGVYGWRLDVSVLPYPAYEHGDPPPEPEAFRVEDANLQRGLEELGRLHVMESAERISIEELQEE